MGRVKTVPERYRIIIDIEPKDSGHAAMRRLLKAKAGPSWSDCELDMCDCLPVYFAWTSIAKVLGQDPGPDIAGDMTSLVITLTLQKCGVVPGDDRDTVVRKITEAPGKVREVFNELVSAAKTATHNTGQKLHLAMARHMAGVLTAPVLADMAADAFIAAEKENEEGKDLQDN